MAKQKYKDQAKEILESVGGPSNVSNVVHCATRLRFHLKDMKKADKEATEKVDGVIQVVESGGQYQVVIGNTVGDVFDVLTPMLGDMSGSDDTVDEDKSWFNKAIDLISGIFTPILPALIGAGMIKGLLMLAVEFGLSKSSGTYQIWYAAGDAVFYFLPILLAVTSANKFKTNTFLALAVAGAMEYPTLVSLFSKSSTHLSFLGIPVISTTYTSSVLPIIFTVYVMSKIEHFCNDHFHPSVKNVLTPLLTLGITVPLAFLIIGPIMNTLDTWLGKGYTALYGVNPLICGLVFGAAWQILVIFGVHWGIVPLCYNNLALYGRDTISGMIGPSNFAQAGAAFGVFLKSKDTKNRELSLSSAITALFSITEPSIYGVNLKFKKPFYIACVMGGVSGAITGAANSAAIASTPVGVLSIPVFVGKGFIPFLIAIAIAFFGTAILTYLFGYDDSMLEKKKTEPVEASTIKDETINSPVKGTSLALSDVNDSVFSSLSLGEGIAISPKDNNIYAPVSGIIRVAYETGHAYGIASQNGAEVLIHAGIDTVNLNGKYFKSHVEQGMKVEQGDLIAEFDVEGIKKAGYDPTVMEIITNTAEYKAVLPEPYGEVTKDNAVIKVKA
ncbi:beta-glucoside-specific PTS transporter subunit IIABC [Lactobacillus corticis]|uniref:PTS system sucrose-specific EIIBCA component n=1 Tax=Lactobacillus corticis TaxID=2201249 RepID=A0A916QKV9_9LACO|nr:beta-glucoside-specific PTS transporter subunit IIABC [Lactobacillus corticis]GFZ27520.1 beta-glucoside-specific PTS system IIABC component [Lactobacillus corticis]